MDKVTMNKVTINATIIASGVELTPRGTVEVPVEVMSVNDTGCPVSIGIREFNGTVRLDMNVIRYNRMFKGKAGEVILRVRIDELDNTQGGFSIRTFTVLGDSPIRCPSIEDLVKDYSDVTAVESAVGEDAAKARKEYDEAFFAGLARAKPETDCLP